MVLKLYGSAMSTSRVLVTLIELNLSYELIPIDISKGEQKTDSYLAMQPFGKVTVLDDDGFIMYESRAICRYLAKKYQTPNKILLPLKDDHAYARFEQACSMEQSYFAAAAETIGYEMFIKPKKGLGPSSPTILTRAENDLDTTLRIYNTVFSQQRYLAGEDLTLADLFHLPNGAALMAGKWADTFNKYEHVQRWFRGLQGRESWVRAAGEAGTIV